MALENIALLIIATIAFVLSIFIYTKNRKNEVNTSFGLLTLCGAVWAFNIAMFRMSTEIKDAWFWDRMIYVFGTVFAPSFLYFSEAFPFRKRILPVAWKFLIFSSCVIFFFFLLFTDLFIESISITSQGNEVNLGLVYLVWVLWFFVFMGWSFTNLIFKYRQSVGISKIQTRYVLLAFLFPAIGSIPFNFIFPYFGNYKLIWIGPFCIVAMLTTIAYTIVCYRFMDIRFVLGRGVVYGLSLITIVALASSLMSLSGRFLSAVPFDATATLILIISILFFQLTFRFFEKFAAKYFYYTFYSYQTVLADLGRRLTRVLDLEQLSSLVVSTLMNTMKLDRTVILLKEPGNEEYQIQKNIGFKEENGISLVRDSFLTLWLEKTQNPLVYEELSLIIRDATEKEERDKLATLQTNMKRIEAALCLPLLIEEKIIGMIVLGNKVSGDPYSSQDIDLLTNLTNQASIALQNARLYDQIEDLSKNLQKKVNEQVKELREAYEELKKLDKAKSEFLSITSHQLRTPLTAIKGYISMVLEKLYGEPPEKMKKPLENIYASNERLIKLVNDLLNISRIEAGEVEMNFEKSSLEEIIISVIEELSNTAKNKNIYLKWEKPKNLLSKASVDKNKIRQVIMNVVDNAIRYTEKGGVTVKAKDLKSKIQIAISDTGAGLTKYELSKMFESFSRGTAGTRLYAEGVGLGLYVAKKFVELHNGKVWAKSKGKGEGSTFYIELPIK